MRIARSSSSETSRRRSTWFARANSAIRARVSAEGGEPPSVTPANNGPGVPSSPTSWFVASRVSHGRSVFFFTSGAGGATGSGVRAATTMPTTDSAMSNPRPNRMFTNRKTRGAAAWLLCRLAHRTRLWQAHTERRAAPERAGDGDFTAEQDEQPPDEREAEADAAVLARHRAVDLMELVEDPVELRVGNADAGVLDLDLDPITE